MFYTDDEDKKILYTKYMDTVRDLVKEKREILESPCYLLGKRMQNRKRKSFFKKVTDAGARINGKRQKATSYPDLPTAYNDRKDTNYFSSERIAVYTCIAGRYDSLREPLVKPDNIDYYAITDFEIPEDSAWKRIDMNEFGEIKDFSPALKNRYFKINPHKVFKDYRYSIYLDGNIRICSDLTEHINRMSKYGFSHFRHSKRTCAYEEAKVCRLLGKETAENIDKYTSRLREKGFPENYGLIACDFMAREHNRPECINIMEQWFAEFRDHLKRDQVSMPYVLYKNGILIDDVATLGGDVHKDYSFEIERHL